MVMLNMLSTVDKSIPSELYHRLSLVIHTPCTQEGEKHILEKSMYFSSVYVLRNKSINVSESMSAF